MSFESAKKLVDEALEQYLEPADSYESGKKDAYENATIWFLNSDENLISHSVDEALEALEEPDTPYESGMRDAYENVWEWLNLNA